MNEITAKGLKLRNVIPDPQFHNNAALEEISGGDRSINQSRGECTRLRTLYSPWLWRETKPIPNHNNAQENLNRNRSTLHHPNRKLPNAWESEPKKKIARLHQPQISKSFEKIVTKIVTNPCCEFDQSIKHLSTYITSVQSLRIGVPEDSTRLQKSLTSKSFSKNSLPRVTNPFCGIYQSNKQLSNQTTSCCKCSRIGT